MNFSKRSFTKEEFLALPVYPGAREVPANTDFLLGEEVGEESERKRAGRMARQKESLLTLLEQFSSANSQQLDEVDPRGRLNVRYWRKLKDGYVSERCGHISIGEIVESMKPKTQQVSNGILKIDTSADG